MKQHKASNPFVHGLKTVARIAVIGIAWLVGLASATVVAQGRVWSDGEAPWFEPASWSPAGLPLSTQEVWIDNGGFAHIATPGAVAQLLRLGHLAGDGKVIIENGGTLAISNALILGTNASRRGTLVVTGTGSALTISGNLVVGASGIGRLEILDGAAVTLGAAASFVGVSNGGSGLILISGAGSSLTAPQTMTVGQLTGAGMLEVADGGLLTATAGIQFAGTSFSNSISISGTAGSRGVIHTSFITEAFAQGGISFSGGILRANSAQASLLLNFDAGDILFSGEGAFIDTNGFNSSIASPMGGTGGLTKIGAGTLTLNAANSFAGATTLEEGTLKSGVAGAFVSDTPYVVNAGTLDLGGFGLTMSSLSGSGGTVLVSGLTLTIDNALDTVYAGAIQSGPSTAVLEKSNVGRLTLSGGISLANSTVRVIHGTLHVQGGTNSSSSVEINPGAGNDATLLVDGGTWTNGGPLSIGGLARGALLVQSGAVFQHTGATMASNIVKVGSFAGSESSLIVFGADSEFISVNNAIDVGSAGSGAVTVSNGGKITLSNAGTILALGTSAPASANIGAPSGAAPQSPGILNVPRISDGTGLYPSMVVLNHTGSDYYLTRDGTASGTPIAIEGFVNVRHEHGVTIVKSANTYQAGTDIVGGTLLVTNTTGSALGTGHVSVYSGATLGGNGVVNANVAVAGGGRLAPGPGIGNLTLNRLNLFDGTQLEFDLQGSGTSDHIQLGPGGITNFGKVQFQFQDAGVTEGSFSFNLISGTGVSALDVADFGFSSAMLFDSAAFQVQGSFLLFNGVFSGFFGGPLLDNSAPTAVPADGNFLVRGSAQTGATTDNFIRSLVFDPGSSLRVFNNLTVTSGNFTINLGTATLIGGRIVVPGDFTKLGAGNLFVNSSVQVGGNTFIRQGELHVNGVFQTGVLFVLPAGFLGGNGVIIGNVVNSGTVGPGNSVGALTISGNFTQNRRGTLEIEIAGPRSFDRLIVGGTAHLNGTLAAKTSASRLKFGQQYPFLQAGHITGSFNRIVLPQPSRFRGRFFVSGSDGVLLIAPASYTLVARDKNETSVAHALDRWIGSTEEDIADVTLALDLLDESQYAQAFNAIMPTYYEAAANTAIELSHNVGQLLHQHLSSRRLAERAAIHQRQDPPTEVRKAIIPVQPNELRDRWRAWLQGSGLFSQGGLSLTPNEDFASGTFLAGADYLIDEHHAIGIFAGYQEGWGDYPADGEINLQSVRFGAYLTYDNGGLYANAMVGGASTDFDLKRPIEWATLRRSTRSHPDAMELFALIGGGGDITAGRLTFGPQFSLQYTRLFMQGATERGSGSLDLKVDPFEESSLRSSIGLRLAATFRLSEKIVLIPELRAFWQHEFLQGSRAIPASLGAGQGPGFTYLTRDQGRDTLFASAGLGFLLGTSTYLGLYYFADLGQDDEVAHTVSVTANWQF